MRMILYLATFFSVIALAFWAYRENYATQQALSEADRLHAQIRIAHARLAVLKAEWAYQNRPERLQQLVIAHYEKMELLPLRAEQFGFIDQVAYPPASPLPLTNAVDVSTFNAPEEGL
ncbi:MAG: cell division protein FtsL [Pseudomonadota bacterium]